MKPILEIKNISKKFTINNEQKPYLSIRDSLSSLFKPKTKTSDFWALTDVNFNVEQGDTIGIIGKNGAGKSTLLKILSKITPPTSGKIICRGRIASLLEVGTGFHPELSGRENIFMNGSILGMRRAEILKNFDAIVDFAGVEKFIDTPLKHYSSGMQLRLAFAVAAFLENEILIIDEVLAVGDAEFQKKCLGKMGDISRDGRTILFVSHDLRAISNLCKKGVCLESGRSTYFESISSASEYYLGNIFNAVPQIIVKNEFIKLNGFKILDSNKQEVNEMISYEKYELSIAIDSSEKYQDFTFAVCINNQHNNRITSLWSAFVGKKFTLEKGASVLKIDINALKLIPGVYELILYFESKNTPIFRIDNFKTINVKFTEKFGISFVPTINQGYYTEDMDFQIENSMYN